MTQKKEQTPTKVSPMHQMFETSDSLESKGVWHDYGWGRVCIARAGGSNTDYLRVFEEETRPYRKQLELGVLDPGLDRQILITVYARSIIKGWRSFVEVGSERELVDGIFDHAGNVVPFNVANVVRALTDLPELFNDIRVQSGQLNLYRQSVNSHDTGN